jgi:alcohol dehydrogenase (cytochrome c)
VKKLLFGTSLIAVPFLLAQSGGLDPADILKPLKDQWTSYSGDMSGKRYSLLKQVDTNTVKHLSLEWMQTGIQSGCGPTGVGASPAGAGGGGRGAPGGPAAPIIVEGLGTGDANNCGPARFGGGILFVNGIIYAAAPDNVYAVDARDGTVLWHFYWKTRGGTSLATRDWAVCLDARNGHLVWKKEIASFDQQYFSSNAPMVLGNHIIVGTGNDMDSPAFLKSMDPETGELQWTVYSTPQNAGEAGLDTWTSLDASRHGAGSTWIPGSYDPETHLYLYGTGNPTPAYTGGRGDGDNLYTCSLIALNVDTGKMAWYYQTSPHDTHDWDSTETPALVDMPFNGRMRKLVITATRNGYFYVLDRVTGEHLLTSKFGLVNNWATAIDPNAKLNLDAKGQPKRNPNKDATIAGSLVNNDVTNYPPPSFSPETGLFYVHEQNTLRVYYLMDPDPRGSMGLGGTGGAGAGLNWGTFIDAIDYKTGKVVWRHELQGGSVGLLTTAGGVLFFGNGQDFEALDAKTGKPLWHSTIGALSSPPETFLLDGKQHVLATGGGALYMFVLN